MKKKISQVEAIRLKKKVYELEGTLLAVKNNWKGTRITSWTLSETEFARVKTANLLNRSVFLHPSYSGTEVQVVAVEL